MKQQLTGDTSRETTEGAESWRSDEEESRIVERALEIWKKARASSAWEHFRDATSFAPVFPDIQLQRNMSAFARGFASFLHQHSLRLPSSVRIAIFSARPRHTHVRAGARIFSPSSIRHYVKATNRLAASAPSVRSFQISDPVLRAVQTTRQPILLYRAPKRQLYMIGVYGLACSCVAGGLFTLRWRYELPTELPFFVGPTYVVVAFILFSIGSWIFTAPVVRCTSIEAIPGAIAGSVQLRIKARFVPWWKDRVIIARLGEPTLDQKTQPITQELIEADRARNQDITDGLQGVFLLRRLGIIAGRFIEQKWTSFFLRFKFAVLRFGIVKVDIHGRKWKIDCSGYMLENGKAIDRLISEV